MRQAGPAAPAGPKQGRFVVEEVPKAETETRQEKGIEPETVVVVLNPEPAGKCFVARRIEIRDGSEIQVTTLRAWV